MTNDARPQVIIVGQNSGIDPKLLARLHKDLQAIGIALVPATGTPVLATDLPGLDSLCVRDVFEENPPLSGFSAPMAKDEYQVSPSRKRNSTSSPAKRLLQRLAEKNRKVVT